MTRAQGRKARDDRYYQANKDAISRRRRERRQSKKDRVEFGAPQLKLVERVPIDQRSADCDPLTGGDRTSEHYPGLHGQKAKEVATDYGEPSRDEPSTYHLPVCHATAYCQATDSLTTDRRGSDCRASYQDQTSGNDSATNQDATDHGRASDLDQASDHRKSDEQTTDHKGTDYEAGLAMIISYEEMKDPSMENLRFQANNVFTFPGPSESKPPKPATSSSGRVPMLVGFHLIVTLCLAALGTCLQFEFYREHDVLPGYALPLSITGAASMLALATVRFPGFRDWPRKLVYAAFYVFFVASSSYHVLSKTWEQSAEHPTTRSATKVSTSDSADRAVEAMTKALEQATKNRAYKTMGILGASIAEQVRVGTSTTAAPEPAGIPHETVRWAGAVILIVLRALLEAAQAIGATALRGYFGTGKYGSRCSSRTAGPGVSYQ